MSYVMKFCVLLVAAVLLTGVGLDQALAVDGVVVPYKEITVASRISAYVKSVVAGEGELVGKDAVICIFDDTKIRQELTKAELELEKLKLENKKLKQGRSAEEEKKLKLNLQIGEIKHKQLKDELAADREIFKTNGISRKELDKKENDLEVARCNSEKARLDLKIAETYPPKIDVQISDQNMAVKQLNVNQIKDKIPYTVIKSSTTRFVKEIMINEGDYITEGKQVAVLLDISKVYVEINVPVRSITDYSIGQARTVTVSLLGNKEFKGKVTAIFPQIDSASGTVKSRILIENPKHEIKPGMLVQVR